jgi:pyridoxine 4-dehydrogenase
VAPGDSIGEHFHALAELRTAGLIRHLGISNVTPQQLTEAQAIAPVVCVQNPYGLDRRSADAQLLLGLCGRHGIAFVPFYAIAGEAGDSGGTVATGGDAVLAVARAHGATTAQVRLARMLHQGQHVLVIPGTGGPDHVAENVAAGALRLPDGQIALLDG